MAFYFCQGTLSYLIKGGYAESPKRAEERMKEHETGAGPMRALGTIADAPRSTETEIFARLEDHQVPGRGDRKRRFEIFLPEEEVIDFIKGPDLAAMGFGLRAQPRDWRQQTTAEWLTLHCEYGSKKQQNGAAIALASDKRLRTHPRVRDAGGGWDLCERVGGAGLTDRQTVFGFDQRLVTTFGLLINRITYDGDTYDYPVFSPWYERHHPGERAPKGAIKSWIPVKPRYRLPAHTKAKRDAARLILPDPRQAWIPGWR